jgi:hypothetical protein
MAQERRINASELDFAQIKANLIAHMKATDTTFNDYNYDGSAMNTVIDVLSYITHINSINANFALNETFLDTAQLRSSIVSHAKLLGYTPRSTNPSVAYINLKMNYDTTETPLWNHDSTNASLPLVIPRGTTFSTTVDSVPYNMFASNTTTTEFDSVNGWVFSNIKIEQGKLKTRTFIYQDNDFEQYVLFDKNVNTKSIKVEVSPSVTSSDVETYSIYTNIVNIDDKSKVYFLEETREGYYEVKFGDGIIGKKPSNGYIVSVEYSVLDNRDLNGTTIFSLTDSLVGNTDGVITLVSKATGGSPSESDKAIKFNAPLGFVSQNRAVTPDDYKSIIQNTYGNIDTLTVWGGEDNIPPDYGKVYISIKPLDGETLSDNEKATIIGNYLKPKNIVSITPILVDPDYTYIDLEVFFKYNPNVANITVNSLAENIRTTISGYNTNTLKSFGGVFRNSNMLRDIDATSIAILSNITRVTFHKKFTPVIGTETRYQFDFNQALTKTNDYYITSSEFVYNGYTCILKDYYNTTTLKNVIRILDTSGTIRNADIGYVESDTGRVVLEGFNLTSIVDTTTKLKIISKPASSDVKPTRNELLTINSNEVKITGEIDTMAIGGTTAGIDYTTVSN